MSMMSCDWEWVTTVRTLTVRTVIVRPLIVRTLKYVLIIIERYLLYSIPYHKD